MRRTRWCRPRRWRVRQPRDRARRAGRGRSNSVRSWEPIARPGLGFQFRLWSCDRTYGWRRRPSSPKFGLHPLEPARYRRDGKERVDMATHGYGQYCPISRALDLLGERWTLMIVRDMLVGATRFNDLARGLPGLSRSLLTQRLRSLERAGLVVRVDGEYLLTDSGHELEP